MSKIILFLKYLLSTILNNSFKINDIKKNQYIIYNKKNKKTENTMTLLEEKIKLILDYIIQLEIKEIKDTLNKKAINYGLIIMEKLKKIKNNLIK